MLKDYIYENYIFGINNTHGTQWAYFRILLNHIENGSSILDVGCGTGAYFNNIAVRDIIRQKGLSILCIDVNDNSISKCQQKIKEHKLKSNVTAICASIEFISNKYDYVLWMDSYPVIDRKLFDRLFSHSLKIAKKSVYVYNGFVTEEDSTIELQNNYLRPILGIITLNDFGQINTIDSMDVLAENNDCECTKHTIFSIKYSDMFYYANIILYKLGVMKEILNTNYNFVLVKFEKCKHDLRNDLDEDQTDS